MITIEAQFGMAPVYYAGRTTDGEPLFSVHSNAAHRFDERADAEDVEQDLLVNQQGMTAVRVCEA